MGRIYLIIGVVIVVVGIAFWLYHHGERVANLETQVKSDDQVFTVVEKKDQIRNNPPSEQAVIQSLQKGDF